MNPYVELTKELNQIDLVALAARHVQAAKDLAQRRPLLTLAAAGPHGG